MLAGTFRPDGFDLMRRFSKASRHPEVLCEEVERDLEQGLFGNNSAFIPSK